MKPPPWIHTMTGSRSLRARAGVQTFRYRQSSLSEDGSCPPPTTLPDCGQDGP